MILVCCLSYNVSVCMSLQLIKHERILYLVKISVGDKEKACLFQELIGLSGACCCLVIEVVLADQANTEFSTHFSK